MLKTYFKIAWRNIFNNKGFSITNITGLAIGMACTILILLWVQDELSWDHFHANHRNIYKIMVNRNFNGEINTDNSVQFPLANALKSGYPEIKNASTDDYGGDYILTNNNTILKKRGLTVSEDFIKIFKWKFFKGLPGTALNSPGNMVITASVAKALFGNEDALNKIIKKDNGLVRKITGVVEDPPANSSIKFDFLEPFDMSGVYIKSATGDWQNCFTETYVELNDHADVEKLNREITKLVTVTHGQKGDFFLFPMDKWRLYSDFKNGKNVGGMIAYVRLFSIIAVIILLIACVNFMNLVTAKSEKRAKEVGIRKTLGSERKQLILQFYSESFIFSILAFVVAILLVYLFLPSFNSLINKQLGLNILNPLYLFAAFVIIILTALISGSYPALYLSSFNPVKVLKGTFLPGRSAGLPRKILVIVQFVISIFLISATILIYKQIKHVKDRDLGYNPKDLISIPSSAAIDKNAEVIKNELTATNLVASYTRTSAPLTDIWNFTPAPDWKGKPPGETMIMTALAADADFAKTIGARIILGRDFRNDPADSSAIILNKAAVDLMQLKDPLGMQLTYSGKTYTLIGITENLVMGSPYEPVKPMMVLPDQKHSNFFEIRLKDGVKPQDAIVKIGAIFTRHNPGYPFEYRFTDQQFNDKFITEDLISKLTNIFAGLAIFICCLGLWGLTSFTIEKRFKELGIRKVLGANVQQLLLLISNEFLFLVSIAFLICLPLSWWLLHSWLQNYTYRIGFNVWLFIGSGVGVLLLTLIIVCITAFRAAIANPVKNLRTE